MAEHGRARPAAGKDFHGRILLLDFWTFCCVNCLHVLDELRPLEQKYGDELVVVGVHSPKFEHERDAAAVAAAVERYDVHHPVLDDPDCTPGSSTPRRRGQHCGGRSGGLRRRERWRARVRPKGAARLIDELIATHDAKGTLPGGDDPYVRPADRRPPALPGQGVVLDRKRPLLVSDSARHSMVELPADGETVLRRIGSGDRRRADGAAGRRPVRRTAGHVRAAAKRWPRWSATTSSSRTR